MSSKLFYDAIDSPVGTLKIICSDEAVLAILWDAERAERVRLPGVPKHAPTHPLVSLTARQLEEYFAGRRQSFDLPLDPVGTPFQKAVWRELSRIPYGKTLSYGEQARRLGDSNKARAVGAANGRNPISILVPCHRVVGKTGDLTGFAGGLDRKRYLLDFEKRTGTVA